MTNDRNVIELNGSQYDALTGGIIAPPVRQSPYQNASQTAQQQQTQNSYGGNHTYNEERLYTHSTQPAATYSQPQSAPAIQQPIQITQPMQQMQQQAQQYTQPVAQQFQQPPQQQAQQTQQMQQTQPLQQPVQQAVTQATPAVQPAQTPQVEQATQAQSEATQVNVLQADYLSAAPALPEVPHVPVAEPTDTTRAVARTAARKAAQHATRRKQTTKTLMRHAVKAPTPTHKPRNTQTATSTASAIKTHSGPTHHKPDVTANTSVSHAHHTTAKSTVHRAQAARHQRAQATIQSDMIDRFRKQPLPREMETRTTATASPLIPTSDRQATQAQEQTQTQQQQQTVTDDFFNRNEQTQQQDQREQRVWPSADRYRADSPDDQDQDFGDIDTRLDDELPTQQFGTQPLAKTHAFESSVFEPHAAASTASTTTAQQQQATNTSRSLETSQIAKLKEQSNQQTKQQTQTTEPTSKFAKAPVQEDIFERALAVASKQQQQDPTQIKQASKRVKKPKRVMRWAASAAVLLAIIGVVALQNRTTIQLQLASSKAGFSASAPGYKPSGFAMAKISYSPGTVSTNYEHNDKSFTVIQKKTAWDSQALLENFVATSNEPYQGYDSKGRTIYVYGQGRATWVNNNVWYQVHADNVLSNEQLVKIASSM